MTDSLRAAVALIHCDLPEPAVLLIKRALRDDDPWSGHWAMPGGRRESSEDLLACARRETLEEIGYVLPEQASERLPDSLAGRAVGQAIGVAVFRWSLPHRPMDLQLDEREVAALYWLPCVQLLDDSLQEQRAMAARLPDQLFPCLPTIEPPLWGFTYRVLRAWWLGHSR